MSRADWVRDEGLLERHLAGDADAFAELYALHYGRLVRRVQRRLGDWHASEEVVQEAFVRTLRALPTLPDRSRFSSWVSVVAD
ncbi:MAG TPA: sigma factor, partial [Pilimelia sp.]|nr:sigma factor [Pilimelia sp.]